MPLTVPPAGPSGHRLVLAGNVVVDLVMRVTRLPDRGDDVIARSCRVRPGGGYHVLAAATAGGLRGWYAGAHGAGAYGELVRAALASIGVDTLQPTLRNIDTGLVVTLVDDGGERTFVTAPDAVQPYTREMLARIALARFDVVYVSGYSLGFGSESVALADWVAGLDDNAVVFCDLGPRGSTATDRVLAPVFDRVDWLACNDSEAAGLTGRADAAEACHDLGRRTHGGVLVRSGAAGCWLATPGSEPELVEAADVGAVQDTTGAGDVHSGCFLAGLAAGLSARLAVLMANQAAAWSVARAGEGG